MSREMATIMNFAYDLAKNEHQVSDYILEDMGLDDMGLDVLSEQFTLVGAQAFSNDNKIFSIKITKTYYFAVADEVIPTLKKV